MTKFLSSKLVYVMVIIKIAITAFALTISTHTLPLPVIKRNGSSTTFDFAWSVEARRLLEVLNQATPDTISSISSKDMLEAYKLTTVFVMGCPGAVVQWKACELNPAYSIIESIAFRMMDLGLFDKVYAFQNAHMDDILKIAFESSVTSREETTLGYALRQVHNYTKGTVLEQFGIWLIKATVKLTKHQLMKSNSTPTEKNKIEVTA
jgi:hypothetical protein